MPQQPPENEAGLPALQLFHFAGVSALTPRLTRWGGAALAAAGLDGGGDEGRGDGERVGREEVGVDVEPPLPTTAPRSPTAARGSSDDGGAQQEGEGI